MDDLVFGDPEVLFELGFHICCGEFEDHIQVGTILVELLTLPSLRLTPSFQSPLLSLYALAISVGITRQVLVFAS